MEKITIIKYIESDPEKWGVLCKQRVRPILRSYRINDPTMAEDILQNVLMNVFRKVKDELKTRADHEGYLIESIKNECKNFLRSKNCKIIKQSQSLDSLKEYGFEAKDENTTIVSTSFEERLDWIKTHVEESGYYGQKEKGVFKCIAQRAQDGKEKLVKGDDYQHSTECFCQLLTSKNFSNIKYNLISKMKANLGPRMELIPY